MGEPTPRPTIRVTKQSIKRNDVSTKGNGFLARLTDVVGGFSARALIGTFPVSCWRG
jgi:hypothetical protein